LLRLSPVTWLEKANKPLLIIQGANDPRVPAGEAVQMHQALAKKGIKSQLILFADEGHGSAKRENRVLEIGNMLQFFLQNL
ncbi:MAG: alpha/beta hydrolase family protein, partial [Pseudobdellovibrionaceae bacterium]